MSKCRHFAQTSAGSESSRYSALAQCHHPLRSLVMPRCLVIIQITAWISLHLRLSSLSVIRSSSMTDASHAVQATFSVVVPAFVIFELNAVQTHDVPGDTSPPYINFIISPHSTSRCVPYSELIPVSVRSQCTCDVNCYDLQISTNIRPVRDRAIRTRGI